MMRRHYDYADHDYDNDDEMTDDDSDEFDHDYELDDDEILMYMLHQTPSLHALGFREDDYDYNEVRRDSLHQRKLSAVHSLFPKEVDDDESFIIRLRQKQQQQQQQQQQKSSTTSGVLISNNEQNQQLKRRSSISRSKFKKMINNLNNKLNIFKKHNNQQSKVNNNTNKKEGSAFKQISNVADLPNEDDDKNNKEVEEIELNKTNKSQKINKSGGADSDSSSTGSSDSENKNNILVETIRGFHSNLFQASGINANNNNSTSTTNNTTNNNISINSSKFFATNKQPAKITKNMSSNSLVVRRSISEPGKADDDEQQELLRPTPIDAAPLPPTPRKQIHFNLEEKQSKEAVESRALAGGAAAAEQDASAAFLDRSSSVNLHDKLNQLKADAINSKRFAGGSLQSRRRRGDASSFCKPANIRESIKNMKSFLYKILERPVGHLGFAYRVFSFTVIMCSIIIGSVTTLDSPEFRWASSCLFWYELAATIFFSIEYILRVWSSGYREQYEGITGRLKFMRRPMHVIELLVIILNIILLSKGVVIKNDRSTTYSDVEFEPGYLPALRFFQILRFLYIDRHAQSWILLMKVVFKHRFELLTSVYIGVIILLFSSYLILIFEKPLSIEDGNQDFISFADAIYWSIITMTTIGYGDRSPKSFAGKIISTSLCIVGVAFWTLPGGIIGSGFALKVEQKNKKKQFNRLLPASATLIQAWWRVKATENLSAQYASCLIATVKTFDISKPIISQSLRRLKHHLEACGNTDQLNTIFAGLDKAYDANANEEKQQAAAAAAAAMTKKSSLSHNLEPQQHQQQHQPEQKKDEIESNQNEMMLDSAGYPLLTKNDAVNENGENVKNSATSQQQIRNMFHSSHSSNTSQSNNEESSILLNLSPEHLILIRTILMLKLFVAKHKFKLAFKPYDFKDVIEQYTQGNMDIMLKIKDLQRKIEQVTSNSNNMMMLSNQQTRFNNAAAAAAFNAQMMPLSAAFNNGQMVATTTAESSSPQLTRSPLINRRIQQQSGGSSSGAGFAVPSTPPLQSILRGSPTPSTTKSTSSNPNQSTHNSYFQQQQQQQQQQSPTLPSLPPLSLSNNFYQPISTGLTMTGANSSAAQNNQNKLLRKQSKSKLMSYYEQTPINSMFSSSSINNNNTINSNSNNNAMLANERLNKIESDIADLGRKLEKFFEFTLNAVSTSTAAAAAASAAANNSNSNSLNNPNSDSLSNNNNVFD